MCAAPQIGAVGLQEHARFFDHLVELVPAKHYYDDEHQHLNTRFLAKAAREAAKEEMKAQYKLNKRSKLDPDQAATALDLQRRKTQAGTSGRAGEEGPSTSQPTVPGKGQQQRQEQGAGLKLQLSGASLSRQELLERLHKKIEDARERRKAAAETAEKAKEWRQKALQDNVRDKQQQQQQQAKHAKQQQQQQAGNKRKAQDGPGTAAGGAQQQQPDAKRPKQQQQQQRGDEADLKFPRLDVDEGSGHGAHGRKRPPKAVLLKQAEARKAELAEAATTEEGKAKVQGDAWRAALARAKGEKVLDDPKLLRRSLKREAKRKEKNTKAWKERSAVQKDVMQQRQAKRKGNLDARRQVKFDNKKAKREKKLLRPGFEGRKEGFITPKAKAAAPAAAK